MILSKKVVTLLLCLLTCETPGFTRTEQFPFITMQNRSLIVS